jgi:hypothetical protein
MYWFTRIRKMDTSYATSTLMDILYPDWSVDAD